MKTKEPKHNTGKTRGNRTKARGASWQGDRMVCTAPRKGGK